MDHHGPMVPLIGHKLFFIRKRSEVPISASNSGIPYTRDTRSIGMIGKSLPDSLVPVNFFQGIGIGIRICFFQVRNDIFLGKISDSSSAPPTGFENHIWETRKRCGFI